jgi:hypothetical protein
MDSMTGDAQLRGLMGRMRSHGTILGWCLKGLAVTLLCAIQLAAAENLSAVEMIGVDVDPTQTVCQKIVAVENACTPAVALNALRFGPASFRKVLERLPSKTDQERLTHLIERFGAAPSSVEPEQKVFDPKRGVFADDFPKFFNAILETGGVEPLTGAYFDLQEKETPEAHLRRIHAQLAHSLGSGVPVITSIRSFAAVQHGDKYLWDGLAAHTILIVRVPKDLAAQAQGFAFGFIEPSTGAVREGYIYAETARGFQAAKGSGQTKFKWLDRGFLLVVAPSLIIETSNQPWYARTFLTLNYGLGAFASME